MAGPGDLHALAEELLEASVDALNTIPLVLPGFEGAPDRSFVSPSTPAAGTMLNSSATFCSATSMNWKRNWSSTTAPPPRWATGRPS